MKKDFFGSKKNGKKTLPGAFEEIISLEKMSTQERLKSDLEARTKRKAIRSEREARSTEE